jgi:hypothetical protein
MIWREVGSVSYTVDIVLRQGFSIDHLTDLLRSNPRYIFNCNIPARRRKTSRHASKKVTYKWQHKKYGGVINLRKENGVFWAEIEEESQLLGAFVSWLYANAGDMVYRLDIRQA